MSMPLMDKKGYFHRIGFFPAPSTFDVSQNIPLAIQLKKKSNMLVHIHQLLHVQ